jgi:hypothetical protein
MHKRYFNVEEAAEYLGLTKHTLNLWRKNKTGPKYYKPSRHILYDVCDLQDWVESGLVETEA